MTQSNRKHLSAYMTTLGCTFGVGQVKFTFLIEDVGGCVIDYRKLLLPFLHIPSCLRTVQRPDQRRKHSFSSNTLRIRRMFQEVKIKRANTRKCLSCNVSDEEFNDCWTGVARLVKPDIGAATLKSGNNVEAGLRPLLTTRRVVEIMKGSESRG